MVEPETSRRQIILDEYQTLSLPAEQIPARLGEHIWRTLDQRGKKVQITFPSPKTDNAWQLTALGWVGQINLPQITLTIRPKVPIVRLFQLWELAYGL